jgi:DNA invertase Pin-like site-specific DNA recombinase
VVTLLELQERGCGMKKKQLTAAIYLRISDEDEALELGGESNSIAGQRMLIKDFVANHKELQDYHVVEVVDDGYSGTNFLRPGIQSLLEMAKKKEIQCIVVKDFSRFGRNYLEVGSYLEQIFPFLGIRFFSVNDGFDSFCNVGAAGSLEVGFKNIIYEAYSKDLSVKIKSVRKSKAEQGKFVTAFAPYGYKKDKNNKNKLIIDQESAPIVNRIFKLYLNGSSKTDIARRLNEEGILCPMMIRRKRGENFNKKGSSETCIWTVGTISHILADQRYTGDAIYGKSKPESVGSKREIKVPKEQWIIATNVHESIISHEEYEAVQKMKKSYKERIITNTDKSLLPKKIICKSCGHSMTRIHREKKILYCCRTGKNLYHNICYQGYIDGAQLEKAFLVCFEILTALTGDISMHHSHKLEKTELLIAKEKRKYLAFYESYRQKKLSELDLREKSKDLERSIDTLQNQYNEMKQEMYRENTHKPIISKEALDFLVKSMEMEPNGSLSIQWDFMDPYQSVLS